MMLRRPFNGISKLRHFLQVLAFTLVVATIQYAFMPDKPYGPPVVYSILIGTFTWAVIDLGRELIPSPAETGWPHGWQGMALVAGGIVVGYVAGTALANALCVYYFHFYPPGTSTTGSDQRTSILITAIAGLVAEAEAELGQTGSVGIGIPGAESLRSGLIKNATSTCLIGQPLRHALQTLLRREVRLANDANCFALSEAIDGAGRDVETVFGVILGTGVGGGIVIRRQVLVGANAIAGEWGHNPLPPRGAGWKGGGSPCVNHCSSPCWRCWPAVAWSDLTTCGRR